MTEFLLNKHEVAQRRSLPLEAKVKLTLDRIRKWWDHYNGDVYIARSGGLDSTVLCHLVWSILPDVPAVFCDTGLEYPDVRQNAKADSRVVVVRPKKTFPQVVEEYGYPVISKHVSRCIWDLRRGDRNPHTQHLRLTGINQQGGYSESMKIPDKWLFLREAPFAMSDKCCDVLKKLPMTRYERESKRKPIIGTRADESGRRLRTYMMQGCNPYSSPHAASSPMAFWTHQDVLWYIHNHRLPVPPVYGSITFSDPVAGTLETTGVTRTGCMYCMFRVHLEKEPNRFQRMKTSHPTIWKYCLDKLGIRQVLDYVKVPYE